MMEKYFANGLKDYKTVGLIMALSVLQNGKIPNVFRRIAAGNIYL